MATDITQVKFSPAEDGKRDFSGKVIERPHCPSCDKQMTWDGDDAAYYCGTQSCKNFGTGLHTLVQLGYTW